MNWNTYCLKDIALMWQLDNLLEGYSSPWAQKIILSWLILLWWPTWWVLSTKQSCKTNCTLLVSILYEIFVLNREIHCCSKWRNPFLCVAKLSMLKVTAVSWSWDHPQKICISDLPSFFLTLLKSNIDFSLA